MIGAAIAAVQAGLLGLGHGGYGQHGPHYGADNYNSALGRAGFSGAYPGSLQHSGLLSPAYPLEFNGPFAHGNSVPPSAEILSHGSHLGQVGHINHAGYPGAPNGFGGPLGHGTFGRAISHVDRTDVIQTSPVGHAGATHLAALGHEQALSPALNLANTIPHAHISNVIHHNHAAPSSHLASLAHATPYAAAAGPLAHSGPLGHSSHLGYSSPLAHASLSNGLGSYGYAKQYAGAENYFVCIYAK